MPAAKIIDHAADSKFCMSSCAGGRGTSPVQSPAAVGVNVASGGHREGGRDRSRPTDEMSGIEGEMPRDKLCGHMDMETAGGGGTIA